MAGTRPIRIAVDAMGGDLAPAAVLEGVALSRVRHPDARFILHGDEAKLNALASGRPGFDAPAVTIKHAPGIIAMDAKPSAVLRSGRDSSMWRAIADVGAGEADVAMSCGNTGALMAMALIQLRAMDGIDRPAIAALWPTLRGQSVVLDVGATVEADADQLVDFAIMGEAFARSVLGLKRPTVGLLNVGEEETKGHEAVREAARILRASRLPIEFDGFVEGDDISMGAVDVVVTDGFTGNIALKTAEGTAKLVGTYLKQALTRSFFAKLGAVFAAGALKALKTRMDPRSVNGGVFLGLNGVVVKSHGGSDGYGIATALDLAIDMARADMPARIAHDLKMLGRPDAAPAGTPEAAAP